MKWEKIDPYEADKLRSGDHTKEELEKMREKAKEQLHEMRKNQDKPLSKEEKERRERESF